MRDREHPHPALLLGFLQGETSQSESRAIVRHLLSGCPSCLAVTRPLWRVADGRGRRALRLVRERRA
jgi:hypothetical protein